MAPGNINVEPQATEQFKKGYQEGYQAGKACLKKELKELIKSMKESESIYMKSTYTSSGTYTNLNQ